MKIFKYVFYLIFIAGCAVSLHAFLYELPAPMVNTTEEVILPNDF